jgi:hypothetical protein
LAITAKGLPAPRGRGQLGARTYAPRYSSAMTICNE